MIERWSGLRSQSLTVSTALALGDDQRAPHRLPSDGNQQSGRTSLEPSQARGRDEALSLSPGQSVTDPVSGATIQTLAAAPGSERLTSYI